MRRGRGVGNGSANSSIGTKHGEGVAGRCKRVGLPLTWLQNALDGEHVGFLASFALASAPRKAEQHNVCGCSMCSQSRQRRILATSSHPCISQTGERYRFSHNERVSWDHKQVPGMRCPLSSRATRQRDNPISNRPQRSTDSIPFVPADNPNMALVKSLLALVVTATAAQAQDASYTLTWEK